MIRDFVIYRKPKSEIEVTIIKRAHPPDTSPMSRFTDYPFRSIKI